jgi:hypothetical protein
MRDSAMRIQSFLKDKALQSFLKYKACQSLLKAPKRHVEATLFVMTVMIYLDFISDDCHDPVGIYL